MSSVLRQDVDFNSLFKKLGHHLEEIRVRALENILSKLEHKLICDSDLVQERHLFIQLLEWFNFPKASRHSDVLNLLLRLSEHTSAAEVIQDIGGIEFLTVLRKDVTSALQPIIDQILENTMRLPDVQPQDHAPECIYQKQNNTGMTGGMETTVDSVNTRLTMEHSAVPSSYVQTETAQKLPDYREPPLGFFEGDPGSAPDLQNIPLEHQQQINVEVATDGSACFKMTIFPWLPLTPTDRHVIVSTNSSLQSREASMLVSTCEFLSDVVFQDFPAEIFLQRPNIIKNLLSLLSGPSQDLGRPQLQAVRTLADYASCLRSKINCHQDPNLYTSKQDFSSTPTPFSTPSSSTSAHNNADGRPSVIGWTDMRHRGDGRDGDTSASSTGSSRASSVGLNPAENEQMDFEDMQSLQFIQMTIPQFCAVVLEKSLPLLKTNDEVLSTEVFRLLTQMLEIIVAIVTPELWFDNSMAGRDCSEKFIESLDVLADLLKYHHHSNMPYDIEESTVQGPSDLVQHRLAYIGLSVFMGNFLKTLVPIAKSRGIISENLLSALNMMVYDECLSNALPDLQVLLLGYMKQLDEGRYNVYVSTATICQSLQKTCKFLTLCQEEASRLSKDTLSMCEGAFICLPYHRHLNYVTEIIKLSSDVCSKSQHYEVAQDSYRKLVLKCLSHPIDKIRLHAYINVLNTVKTHLSVAKASDPTSTSCLKVKFIINADILYEVIVFGLADKDAKIASCATDIMSHLLKSQLLMSTELWQAFLQAVMRGLPILQSYAGPTTVIGTTVLSMLEPKSSESPNELSHIEKFRGTLRCMLSSDLKVRAEALKRLSWYLSNETNSGKKLPVFSDLDVSNLSNIFIVDTQRSVEDLGRSVFQVDGLRKVYEIFTSLSVDPGVKKSAVDQLAIILQDPTLHPAFKKDGGFEKILAHLQLGVLRDGDSNTNNNIQYLPGCMTVLRHLIHHDYSLRHKMAHNASLYYTLLRVALLHHRDERTCYEVSHVLTLLLFDEQARFYMGGSKTTTFSIPNIVKLRYKLPFRANTHFEKSPNRCASPPDPDPLMTGQPLEMMRITWNAAWHSGMDSLVKTLAENKSLDANQEFSPKLKLTPTDRVVSVTSHVKQGLQSAIYDISNSTSHHAVSRSLTRLLSYLVVRCDKAVTTIFHTLDWCGAIARFVKVTPSSSADESLLLDILRFISIVLKLTNHAPDNILQWVGEVLYHPKGPLIGLLHRQAAREAAEEVSEPLVNIKRSLDKSLLAFISAYNSSLPYQLTVRLKFHQLRGDLAYKLIQRLNVTDAPHFYNLASLEGTLQCLMHITARYVWPGFGSGKGLQNPRKKMWPKKWLYSRHADDASGDLGLDWMLTLWAYRDAEVRSAGLGIAVTLSITEEGRLLLTTNCKHIPGGIWAAAFSILLDQSECSMVRQQAALLLVNLTSHSLPSGSSESDHKTWLGPVVMDTESQVSLTGLTALLALLHHCQFYREMTVLLSSYYPQPTIQPSVTSDLYQLSASASDNTLSVL
ncbi:rotatin-like, partial [Ruditapes philippinarum]|uniref:rotatin-like n=1 Tax=Ruditapes philippinarum TaxID=129788 RepID=UPI00295B1C9C